MSNIADAAVRTQALDINHSFVVTAPAGSGKTELLTRRLLTLLAICQQPEDILCITFTRKAAGEMRERILGALQLGMGSAPDDAVKHETWQLAQAALANMQARQWQLLENSQRLQITTIDSLCRTLAQHLPFESGLGSLPGTLDMPDALYQQAARNTLARLEHDETLRPALASLLLHLDNDHGKTEKLIVQLLQKREQWLPHLLVAHGERQALEDNISALLAPALQHAHDSLSPHAATLLPLLRFAADNLRDKPEHFSAALRDISALPAVSASTLPQWQAIANMLLTGDGEWRRRIDKNIGFPAEKNNHVQQCKAQFSELLAALTQQENLREQLVNVRELPQAQYRDSSWQVLQQVTTVMMQAVAELKVLFAGSQQSDFTEITLAALQSLGDDSAPTDLALRLDYRIQHILVDEFQDTNQPQYTLLEKLTRGWQTGDGRTLFLVGDAMQSCYGFREANVGLFMQARRYGISHVPLCDVQLSVNFRSQAGIVDWVNQTFSQAFPNEEDNNSGATCYCPAIASKPTLPGRAVHCHGFVGDDGTAQAETMATEILRLQAECPDDSIAVLVRSRTPLLNILPVLREHGIHWQATDIEALAAQMPVLDVFTLTRALLSPTDDMAWMALLRTPWLGLTNADLLALAQHRHAHTQPLWQTLTQWQQLDTLSMDAQQLLARSLPVLQCAVAGSWRKNLRSRVQGCWQGLGGLLTLRSSHDYEQVMRFFALLEQQQQAGTLPDLSLFEQALDKLYATPAPSNTSKPVQIMTMHKSKGLQFDHVFLPQLGKGKKQGDTPLLRWHEHISDDVRGHSRLLLDILPEAGQSKKGTLYHYLGELKKQKEQHETLRVLYVACTRAIKQLHLFASVNPTKNANDDYKPVNSSMAAAIWPVFSNSVTHWHEINIVGSEETDEDETDEETGNTADNNLLLTQLYRLPATTTLPAVPDDTLMQPWRAEVYRGKVDDNDADPLNRPAEESAEHYAQRSAGKLLHRLLQCLAEDGLASWPAARIDKLAPRWQKQLQLTGVTAALATTHSQRIAAALRHCLQDPRAQWLLHRDHRAAQCEYALYDGERQHVIDRTFMDGNTRWIIDYKSTESDSNEKTFLTQQLAQHSAQLLRYRELFIKQGETDVRCALYFPLNGRWLEISP